MKAAEVNMRGLYRIDGMPPSLPKDEWLFFSDGKWFRFGVAGEVNVSELRNFDLAGPLAPPSYSDQVMFTLGEISRLVDDNNPGAQAIREMKKNAERLIYDGLMQAQKIVEEAQQMRAGTYDK